MSTLASELRSKLERVIIEAREVAELGARATLEAMAVHHYEPYPHMNAPQRSLRNHLRARARQLGDRQDSTGRVAIDHLVSECAYEHWHRMLFARFLAENNLLIEAHENIAISLVEAEELAKEDGVDVWVFASRCAQQMLPQIFRPDDPLLQVSFATEHMLKLEGLLASLPQAVFTASDALGWVYQFWQSKKKDEVNRSEVKIGADEISAVTQLFTEPYMVEFLLHNTLGAWWAGKNLASKDAASAKTEDELRHKLALPGVGWWYLRFVRGEDGVSGPWRPAAGTFDGWPKVAAELKVLDPCCGSGHFLVAALHHFVPIRMAEESLAVSEAIDAVLRDNLHGLEIDERCCQIAAFALAFAAWTYPGAGGYRPLPDLHIASTGIGPHTTQEQWLKLAELSGIPMPKDRQEAIKNGLLNLHRLFSQAPTLGSLISPAGLPADLIAADYKTIQPYLVAILSAEKADDETRERAIAAAGMIKATEILAAEYTLVITNVPYLARGKQSNLLRSFAEQHCSDARHDLATIFLDRCLRFVSRDGTIADVIPQNWLFLQSYERLRHRLLSNTCISLIGAIGANGFRTPMWDFKIQLSIITNRIPHAGDRLRWIEAGGYATPEAKAQAMIDQIVVTRLQLEQLRNPGNVISGEKIASGLRLGKIVDVSIGLQPGQTERLVKYFWEVSVVPPWRLFSSGPSGHGIFDGNSEVIVDPAQFGKLGVREAVIRGKKAWQRPGVIIQKMGLLRAALYAGELFDDNAIVLTPRTSTQLPSLWSFVSSNAFAKAIRSINKKASITAGTVKAVAMPDGESKSVSHPELTEPESDDPTQWLFHGRPEESSAPLQVAVARLRGFRWPAELDDKMRLSKRARVLVKRCDELDHFAEADGVVCIPSVRGEEPAADRLLTLLGAAGISPAKARELAGGIDLEDWLRNEFFEEHCKLFHDRPFIWHIWDGRKHDGFHALVNYHKLCEGGNKGRKLLESLTYSYLGEWISRQKDGIQRAEGGAEDRLAASVELQKRLIAILEGEPPFDIFVRWKPLYEQPMGWEPDINDGMRVNIRPFLASDLSAGRTGAGVLRWRPNIKWTKDRGKEPDRPKAEYPWFWGWDEKTLDFMGGKTFDGNRWNDCHYTNKTKQAARDASKGAKGA